MEQQPAQASQPMLTPMGLPRDTSPMSMKDWVITLLIQAIPIAGLVMLLVWAFDNSTNVNRQNYAKGALIVYLIFLALGILLAILFIGVIGGMISSLRDFR